MSEMVDFAEDALAWLARAIAVLPAFKALWQAVSGGDADQEFAAQLELARSIRRKQAAEEIAALPSIDTSEFDKP